MHNRHSRWFAFLTLISIVAGNLAGCGGAEESKTEHFERAKKYLEENNLDKAKVELKNVLQIDPKFAKPYFYLGQIEEAKQNWRAAFGFYQKTVELDANDTEAKIKLAALYLMAKQADKAQELIEAARTAAPDNVDVRMLGASLANLKGNREPAIAEMKIIAAENPARVDAFLGLAALYSQAGKLQEAENTLQQGLTSNPGNTTLLMTLAKLSLQQNKPAQTEEILKQLIASQPATLGFRTTLADVYTQQNRLADAEQVLRAAIEADRNDPNRYLLLAQFLARGGKSEEAVAGLVGAIKALPEAMPLRFGLASLYEQLNRADQAEQTYRELIELDKDTPDALKAKVQLARLALAKGQTDAATQWLNDVLEKNPNDTQALLLRGSMALSRNDAQQAIASFRSILKDAPDNLDVLTLLARGYLLDGKTALAQETFDKASTTHPENFGARKNLVEFLVQQKNNAAAMEKLDEFLKVKPNSLEGLNLKADLLALEQKTGEAEALLKRIKADFPDKPIGAFRLATLYQSQKKFDQALAEYEQALRKSENDYEPLKAIVGVYLAMQKPDKALARLKKALADNPKHPTAHQLLGLYYATQKQYDEAVKACTKAIEVNPRWPLPYVNLAAVYEQQGKTDRAIETYEQGLRVVPRDPNLYMNLARLYQVQENYDNAIKTYENALAVNPNDALVINNLASLLSMDAGNAENLKRALELAKRFESSSQPVFVDTLAWIYYLQKDYDKALPLMQKAVDKAPEIPILRYHLGMVYFKKDEKALAKEELTKAVGAGKEFDGLAEAKETLKKL